MSTIPTGIQGPVAHVAVGADGKTVQGTAANPFYFNATVSRQLVGPFVRDNIAASLTDSRAAVGATAAPELDIVMTRAGYVVGVSASFTVAPAGSTATVEVFKNGALIHSSGELSVTAGSSLARFATFTDGNANLAFAAGDKLGIAITTDSSWTATTSDMAAMIEVSTSV